MEEQAPGIQITCLHCGASTRRRFADSTTGCPSCSSPLPALTETTLRCGWCQATGARHLTDSCRRCGGPLPSRPGRDPGPRPPATPRRLPRGYERRARLTGSPRSLLGASLLIVTLLLALPLPMILLLLSPVLLIGGLLVASGQRQASRRLHPFTAGVATRGELTEVRSVSDGSAWRVGYRFELHGGGSHDSTTEVRDPAHARRAPGDRIRVTYTPDEPARHTIWPPIR